MTQQDTHAAFMAACADVLTDTALLTDPVDTAPFLTDWTGEYTGQALAIARPTSTQQVAALIKLANVHGVSVVPQGGRTGLAGGAVPSADGANLVIAMERMNAIRRFDPASRSVVVEAGVILEVLQNAAREHDLIYPMTFGAKGSCMIGANLATNAGGSNVVRYGNTRELCIGIEAVLPDGSIVNGLSGLRKDNTGLDIKNLLIGSEGTLGIITAAVMKLAPRPTSRATAFLSMRSLSDALDTLNALQNRTGGAVEAYEYMPQALMDGICRTLPKSQRPLKGRVDVGILVEVASTRPSDAEMVDGSTRLEADLLAELELQMEQGTVLDAVLTSSERQRDDLWHMREMVAEVIRDHGRNYTFDLSLPLGAVAPFVERMDVVAADLDFHPLVVGHLGDGNLHYSLCAKQGVDFATLPLAEAKKKAFEIMQELRGSFSAEHGIGQSKLDMMHNIKDPVQVAAMQQIKRSLDPKNLMNPGKLIPGI